MSNYERIYKAMTILVGAGGVRERLANAYRDEVQFLVVDDLSEIARVELETIRDELTKTEPSGESDAIDMSVGLLSEAQAEEMALELLDIYDELACHQRA